MTEAIWNVENIAFLKENYPIHGVVYCAEKLSLPIRAVKRKIDRLKIKKVPNPKYELPHFSEAVAKAKSYMEVARNLNMSQSCGNRRTISKYIKLHQLDISHFDGGLSTKRQPRPRISLNEILVRDSTYTSTTLIKKRLYDTGIKKRKCELCGQGEEWNGKHMSLILDHINGVNDDNRIENLQMVCPNCNATLETFGGKNKKFRSLALDSIAERLSEEGVCACGKKKWRQSSLCASCFSVSQRRVERPSIEKLKLEIEALGFSGTGRKYGVSDNAIRKWIRLDEKEKL